MPEEEGTPPAEAQPEADTTTTTTTQETAPSPDESALGDAGKQALDRMKAERNAAASQAKALQKELDKVRQSAMSESERAVAEAEARGRTTALTEVGQRLARAQFDALAGRRNPDADTAKVLDFVDLSRFVGDDGEPDVKAITAAVERLIPESPSGPPSFDGGARTSAAKPADMNALIRGQLGSRS